MRERERELGEEELEIVLYFLRRIVNSHRNLINLKTLIHESSISMTNDPEGLRV